MAQAFTYLNKEKTSFTTSRIILAGDGDQAIYCYQKIYLLPLCYKGVQTLADFGRNCQCTMAPYPVNEMKLSISKFLPLYTFIEAACLNALLTR